MDKKQFIETVAPLAQKYSKVFLPSITIAQAIHESAWGTSELATNAKNILGMKADDTWNGDVYVKDAIEEIDGEMVNVGGTNWRKYDNWEENIEDHDNFLTRTDWHADYYKDAINATNYVEQANALQGTYATDTSYASHLNRYIEQYDLSQYDPKPVTRAVKKQKIVIDAGHGGTDPGAQANGLIEKHWNLEVAKKLQNKFESLGHEVLMIRTSDVYLSLKERSDMANKWNADIFISVHFNAGGGYGYEDFIYNKTKNQDTKNLQNKTHAAVITTLNKHNMKNRGKKTDNFHVLRETNMPAILLEGGFCDTTDYRILADPKYKEDLAVEVVNGVQNYIGNTQTVEPQPVVQAEPQKQESSGTYTVKTGDTLGAIAQKFNVTVDNLVAWNNIQNKNVIHPGQVLTVKNGTTIYTVKSGDNLSKIADKFDTTVQLLAELNDIDNVDLISVGQKIKVNGTEKVVAPVKAKSTYVVKAGDTLSEIAADHGVSMKELAKQNGINNENLIRVGQKIYINGKPNVQSYTVKSGDTLSEIAGKLGVKTSHLQAKNNIENAHKIYPGQKIRY